MEDRIDTLQPGAVADVVVAEFVERKWELTDTFSVTETGRCRLEPRFIFRAGQQVGVLPRPCDTNGCYQPQLRTA